MPAVFDSIKETSIHQKMRENLKDTSAWKKLLNYYQEKGQFLNIQKLFEEDLNRFEK